MAKGVTGWGGAKGLRVAGIGEVTGMGRRPGGHAPREGTCLTKAFPFHRVYPFTGGQTEPQK